MSVPPVNARADALQRRFEPAMMVFALLSVPSIYLDEIHGVPHVVPDVLDWIIWDRLRSRVRGVGLPG
jgi:hypothetical protein